MKTLHFSIIVITIVLVIPINHALADDPVCIGGPGMCGPQPTPQEKQARTYLFFPFDVTTDNSGNIYVADSGNDRIVKFDPNGNYLMQFGISGNNDGQFMDPRGVVVDGAGKIYVADTINERIQKFDSDGRFLLAFGSYGTGKAQFHGPDSVAVDKSGFVYVADVGNARIEKFDSSGNFILEFGTRGQNNGELDGIERITVDNSRYLYITSTFQGVQIFDGNGNYVKTIPLKSTLSGNNAPDAEGVSLDKNGNIYVAGYNQARIQKFGPQGNFEYEFGSFGSGQGQFDHPGNIAVDNSGNILVADADNNRIEKLDSLGKFISFIQNWNSTSSRTSFVDDTPPVIITQVELDSPFVFLPDNQTCYDKPGFASSYTCSTDIVPGKKVQCAYFLGSNACEPIHQYTGGTNRSCLGFNGPKAPQWFDMYNTQNKSLSITLFEVQILHNMKPWAYQVAPIPITLEPHEGCTYGFGPVDGPLSFDQTNMSFAVTYSNEGKNYTATIPSLTDQYNDNKTWQFDGNKWIFVEQNTMTVPEFPLAIPILFAGFVSAIVFYRMKFRK